MTMLPKKRGTCLPAMALLWPLAGCYTGAPETSAPDEGQAVAARFVEAMATVQRDYLQEHACDGFSIETFDNLMADVGEVAGPLLDELGARLVHNAALSGPDRQVFDADVDGVLVRASVLSGQRPCVIVEVQS